MKKSPSALEKEVFRDSNVLLKFKINQITLPCALPNIIRLRIIFREENS